MTPPPDNLDADGRNIWAMCCDTIQRHTDPHLVMTALWIRRELTAESKHVRERDELREALGRAIDWLRRLEIEHPGCLNQDAIDKHLMPAFTRASVT